MPTAVFPSGSLRYSHSDRLWSADARASASDVRRLVGCGCCDCRESHSSVLRRKALALAADAGGEHGRDGHERLVHRKGVRGSRVELIVRDLRVVVGVCWSVGLWLGVGFGLCRRGPLLRTRVSDCRQCLADSRARVPAAASTAAAHGELPDRVVVVRSTIDYYKSGRARARC